MSHVVFFICLVFLATCQIMIVQRGNVNVTYLFLGVNVTCHVLCDRVLY